MRVESSFTVYQGDKTMTPSATQVIQTLLASPLDLAVVKSVTTPDVIYVSLNENNPELKRYLPWAGTNKGPESIVRAFEAMGRSHHSSRSSRKSETEEFTLSSFSRTRSGPLERSVVPDLDPFSAPRSRPV